MPPNNDEMMPDELWFDPSDKDEWVPYDHQWRGDCVKYIRADLATPPPSGDAVRLAVEALKMAEGYNMPAWDAEKINKALFALLRALPADQPDEDAGKALDDMEPLRAYCPDHYDENEQCQIEAAMFLREHFETIRAALQAKAGG